MKFFIYIYIYIYVFYFTGVKTVQGWFRVLLQHLGPCMMSLFFPKSKTTDSSPSSSWWGWCEASRQGWSTCPRWTTSTETWPPGTSWSTATWCARCPTSASPATSQDDTSDPTYTSSLVSPPSSSVPPGCPRPIGLRRHERASVSHPPPLLPHSVHLKPDWPPCFSLTPLSVKLTPAVTLSLIWTKCALWASFTDIH